MKKLIAIVVCVVLCAGLLVACGAPATEETSEAPSEETTTEETPSEDTTEESPAESPEESEDTGDAGTGTGDITIGFYADAADSYYQVMCDALVGAKDMGTVK